MNGETPSARGSVIRDAIIFTPFFLAFAAAWIAAFISEGNGAIPLLVILGLVTLLSGYQSVQALRDLVAKPQVTEGEISRKWRGTDMFVLRSHYIYVNRKVFKIDPLEHQQLEEGDLVAVTHYPHTNAVVSVRKTGKKSRHVREE
ncbi:MAG: hypothetical protein QME71_05265 [Dehalococcoidia bacterium]|nr:hypothetical protein [Dehalococcoidia bacterium]